MNPGQRLERADKLLLILLGYSMIQSFFFGQDETVVPGSLKYYLIVLPFLLGPMLAVRQLGVATWARMPFLVAYFVIGSSWALLRGDMRSALQAFFWLWGVAFLCRRSARIDLRQFSWLFILVVVCGVIIDLQTDMNTYGLFTLKHPDDPALQRFSLYPNVANTGIFSFVFLLLFTRTRRVARRYWWILVLASLLAIRCEVRAILISLAVYLGLLLFLRRSERRPLPMMLLSLGALAFALVATNSYAWLYERLRENDLLLKYLFRGDAWLSEEMLANQVYRPAVWSGHLEIFLNSPWWMGVGAARVDEIVMRDFTYGDSVGFLTRLLAIHGLAGALFLAQLVHWLVRAAQRRDQWACAAFPAIAFLAMSWGSVFHPSNGFAMIMLLIVAKGERAILSAPGSRHVGQFRTAIPSASARPATI